MGISILPMTLLGKWSVGLNIAWLILFITSELILGPGPVFNMPLAYSLTVAETGLAITSIVTGIISFTKSKKLSIFVIIAVIIGFYGFIGGIGSLIIHTL